MTERNAGSLRRDASTLRIGGSTLSWDGGGLTVAIDEVCAPLPRRVRGTVRIYPSSVETAVHALDAAGRHRWSPIAPVARVEVALDHPSSRWSGDGYFDRNDGDRPLEQDFARWEWSRATARNSTSVLYDAERRDGTRLSFAGLYSGAGRLVSLEPPPPADLPATRWWLRRRTRADDGAARVVRTLLDSPFYARSLIKSRIGGENAISMHESLSLDRFSSRVVQAMLPFRMPRTG